MAGRPKGSKTVNSTRPWSDALRIAVNEDGTDDKGKKVKKLRLLAQNCVNAAIEGDTTAMKEIGDRLDGKAPQPHIGGEEDDPAINHSVAVRFVGPAKAS